MPVIDGTPNDENLFGGLNADTINGLDGDDNLYGDSGDDVLNGGNDNDYLRGDAGSDKLNGGDGNDYLQADASDILNGGDGVDLAVIDMSTVSTAQNKVLDFSAGALNSFNNGTKFSNVEILQITTGTGNDHLTFGASSVHAPSAYDHYWNAGDGNDIITIDWSSVDFGVYGTMGSVYVGDVSIGFANVEKMELITGAGFDTLYGGADKDTLVANGGGDYLQGYAGDDVMDGGDGNDTLVGGAGSDGSGNDSLTAGAGDDLVYAGFGDTASGGTGLDLLRLDVSDRSTDVNYDWGPSGSLFGGSTTFGGFERLWLTTGSGNDVVTVDSGAILSTNDSSDQYWNGSGGNDKLIMDFSDQSLSMSFNTGGVSFGDFTFGFTNVEVFNFKGGDGFDGIYGGNLNDTLAGNGGNDTIQGYGGNDNLDGGDGRDALYGSDGNDKLGGGDDRDYLQGDGGKDTLTAGDGKDTLTGGEGDDRLLGGAGRDHLQGDAGKDFLQGGTDMDVYRYSAASDSAGRDFDTVDGFDFTVDRFYFSTGVAAFDGKVTGGALDNNANFDNQLEGKFDAAHLSPLHAALYQPGSGDFAGELFLIVDRNNIAGYQDGEDYVIRLTNAVNVGAADLTDFQGPYQL